MLKSKNIGQLINIGGIIINSGKSLLRGRKIEIRCRTCGNEQTMFIEKGMMGVNLPYYCRSGSGLANQ